MHRAELVHMGQDGADALGARLETLVAQQRVEPDQAPTALVQALHLAAQFLAPVALQSIGEEQHAGALAQHPARPQAVELVQGGADARAARPVLHMGRAGGQRLVRVLVAQQARDIGEARPEEEGMHPPALFAQRMEKMQKDAGVIAHGAGDVADGDDGRAANRGRAKGELDGGAPRPQAAAKAAARVDARAPWVGRETAGAQLVAIHAHLRDGGLGAGDLRRAHLREVLALQHLLFRHGEPVVQLHLRLFLLLVLAFEHGVGDARGARRRLGLLGVCGFGHGREHGQQLVEEAALAPENIEGLMEDQIMLVLLHQDCVQGGAEILAGADARHLHRAHRVQRRARAHRQPRRPQRAGEIEDVLRQAARACGRGVVHLRRPAVRRALRR